jgi:hypothetical protein
MTKQRFLQQARSSGGYALQLKQNRGVYLGQDAEIESQSAGINGGVVLVLIVGLAEEHILLEGQVLDPGVLGNVCDSASDCAVSAQLRRKKNNQGGTRLLTPVFYCRP